MNRMEEFQEKETRLHAILDANGLDGILLKKQANFSWLTAGGYNRVGLATEAGVTTLLVTRTGRYLIANRIEMRRMLVEEGLSGLGFEPLEYEWFEDRETELVRNVVPDTGKVGTDTELAGFRLMEGGIRQARVLADSTRNRKVPVSGRKGFACCRKSHAGSSARRQRTGNRRAGGTGIVETRD